MAKPAAKVEPIKKSDRRWQSDIIVDMIKRYGFEYIALNPGASYRGLHDSLVNYGENDPPMLLCQHEKIAVQIAHGYARAKGKPMIAIVHNLVGLSQFRQVGLPADNGRRRTGRLRASLLGHDERAPGTCLHVLRRGFAGSAVGSRCGNAASRGHRCSNSPNSRSWRVGKSHRQARGRQSGRDYRRLCRPSAPRLESYRRAGGD